VNFPSKVSADDGSSSRVNLILVGSRHQWSDCPVKSASHVTRGDTMASAIDEALFTQACVCGRAFTDLGAFTRHQKGCRKGKKRLTSAITKAKEVYQSKRARLGPPSPRFGSDDAETGQLDSSNQNHGSGLLLGPSLSHSVRTCI
jgi:hypothetical protein